MSTWAPDPGWMFHHFGETRDGDYDGGWVPVPTTAPRPEGVIERTGRRVPYPRRRGPDPQCSTWNTQQYWDIRARWEANSLGYRGERR